jgi:hypothetical protein
MRVRWVIAITTVLVVGVTLPAVAVPPALTEGVSYAVACGTVGVADTTGLVCENEDLSAPDLSDGSSTMEMWLHGDGTRLRVAAKRVGGGGAQWGNTQPWLVCVHIGATWAPFSRLSTATPALNSYSNATFTSIGTYGGESLYGPTSTGSIGDAYYFVVDDPVTNYATEWAVGGGDGSGSNLIAVCQSADPGSPGPLFVDAPTIEVEGVLEPLQDLNIFLLGPDHEGELVTCTIQGSLSNPYEGEIGTPDADMYVLDATYQFAVNGLFNIECIADDGLFDDTVDDIEAVRVVVKIGTGVDDILSSSCGAWYNIGCHIGQVLVWAFVPDSEVLFEAWDDLNETLGEGYPVGPFVSAVAFVADILTDLGRGITNPGYYGTESQSCDPPYGSSEACQLGLSIGHGWSEGGVTVLPTIEIGKDSEGAAILLPEFRLLGEIDDDAVEYWAGFTRSVIRILMYAALATFLIRLMTSYMKVGEQLEFKFLDGME